MKKYLLIIEDLHGNNKVFSYDSEKEFKKDCRKAMNDRLDGKIRGWKKAVKDD